MPEMIRLAKRHLDSWKANMVSSRSNTELTPLCLVVVRSLGD